MHITFIYADPHDSQNCSLYNVIYPAKEINKLQGHSADTFYVGEFDLSNDHMRQSCLRADLIIFERNLFSNILLEEMRLWLENKNVAIIFDDDYVRIEPKNNAYDFWHNSGNMIKLENGMFQRVTVRPGYLAQLRRGVRLAKGLICPSRILCDDWKEYTDTYRIHNYLDEQRYPEESRALFRDKELATEWARQRRDKFNEENTFENVKKMFPKKDEKEVDEWIKYELIKFNKKYTFENIEKTFSKNNIIIGWCGSYSHVESFTKSGALYALEKVAMKHDNVRVLIGGDKRVYDLLKIPEGKKFFTEHVPDEQWAALQKSIDIGIAPLSTDFDRRRSWIKVLEYMIMKVPWVATNFETYEELGNYGILTDNNVRNWRNALEYAIENIAELKEKANNENFLFAKSNTYENKIGELLSVYQQIIDAKDRDEV